MASFGRRACRLPTALLIALTVTAAFRVYAFVTFGPIVQPDSADYLDYAKNILSGYRWVHSTSVESVTAFRMVGYPAAIAIAQFISGSLFKSLLVVLQSALTLIAMSQLFRLARRLGLPDWAGACAVLAYGCGAIAVFDLNVLTDSLFANLAVVTICVIAFNVIERKAPRAAAVMVCGILFATCILFRDATLFASPFFALGAAAWGYSFHRTWTGAMRVALLFLVPAVVVWQGYLAWNQYRTGYRFMTTGGQHAFLMKPVMVEQQGIAVLRDPHLQQAYAATASLADGEFFTRVREMGVWLRRNADLDAVQRTALAMRAYRSAWQAAPMAMLQSVLREYRANQFLLLVNFQFAVRELEGLARIEENPGYRVYFRNLVENPQGQNLLPLGLELTGLAISGIVFVGFVGGGLYRLWRVVWCGDYSPAALVPAWLLLLYLGFVGMYAMVHLEMRYTICMQAIVLVLGTAAIRDIYVLVRSQSK
jgi:hypothetical protein